MINEAKILLIIPAYNEGEGIAENIRKVEQYRAKSPYNLDYVVINDGSTDNEEEVLRENNINHVELIQNLGIGGAVQTGYMYADKMAMILQCNLMETGNMISNHFLNLLTPS